MLLSHFTDLSSSFSVFVLSLSVVFGLLHCLQRVLLPRLLLVTCSTGAADASSPSDDFRSSHSSQRTAHTSLHASDSLSDDDQEFTRPNGRLFHRFVTSEKDPTSTMKRQSLSESVPSTTSPPVFHVSSEQMQNCDHVPLRVSGIVNGTHVNNRHSHTTKPNSEVSSDDPVEENHDVIMHDLPPTESIEPAEDDSPSSQDRSQSKKSLLRKRKILELSSNDDESQTDIKRRKTDGSELEQDSDAEESQQSGSVTLGVKRPRPVESEDELASLTVTSSNFLPGKKRPRFSSHEAERKPKPLFLRIVSYLESVKSESNRSKKEGPLFHYSSFSSDSPLKQPKASSVPRARRRIPISDAKAYKQQSVLLQSKDDIQDLFRRTNIAINQALRPQEENEEDEPKTKSILKTSSAFTNVSGDVRRSKNVKIVEPSKSSSSKEDQNKEQQGQQPATKANNQQSAQNQQQTPNQS